MIFICIYYFVSLQMFNSKLLLGYTTIFTMFPIFAMIFDEDVDVKFVKIKSFFLGGTALKYPPLYK